MKIAFVSQGLGRINPPVVSGSISIWTYEVANEIKKSHTVMVYEMDGPPIRWKKRYHEGITYRYAPTLLNQQMNRIWKFLFGLLKKLRSQKSVLKRPLFASPLHNLGYIFLVALDLRKQKCHVVHVHQFSQYVPIIRFFNRTIRIALHMNCEWLTQIDKSVIRRRITSADLIIGCSEYISEKITKRFPDYAQRVTTVYNGVDHRRFRPPQAIEDSPAPKGPNLLFVGRVSPEKGVHLLIDAVKDLSKVYPTLHLHIVGGAAIAPREFIVDLSDDPVVRSLSIFYESHGEDNHNYYDCLLEQSVDGLNGKVTFWGSIPWHEIPHFYRKADILINPSLSESFGMSLVEAMASEVPVVATRVGGMINVVADGETGLLIDSPNKDHLARAIQRLVENPAVMSKMGKSGRRRVLDKFSWKQVSTSLVQEYSKLL
jgi:glycosyltransferase involved in cell wall biosynthesis